MYGELSRPQPSRLLPERWGEGAPLSTERLILRAPRQDDGEVLTQLAGHAEVAAMATDLRHPLHREDAAALVGRAASKEDAGWLHVVTRAADRAVLGCCTVRPSPAKAAAELNFWLGKPYWNKGYTTETAQAVIDLIFESRGEVERIDACCRAMNGAARRVLQKCGFQFQSSSLTASLSLRGNVAVDWYGLDRRLWESLRHWGSLRGA